MTNMTNDQSLINLRPEIHLIRDLNIPLSKWSLMVAWAIKHDDRPRLRRLMIYGLAVGYVEQAKLTDRMVEELMEDYLGSYTTKKVVTQKV